MNDQKPFHKLIDYAWRHSTFYRELYLKHGISEKDLPDLAVEDLPLVTKETLMDNFDEVVTDPRLRKKELLQWLEQDPNPQNKYLDEFIAMYSSGGSATVGITAYDQQAWLTMTSVAASYLWPPDMDGRARIRSAFFFARKGHFASHTSASQVSSRLIQPLILTMSDPLEDVLAQLAAFQPDRLTSYASGISFLAGLTLEGKLPISPREIVMSGDRLTPGMEARIKEAWRAKTYDIYAAVESLYLAVRRPGDDFWTVFDELNMLECLDKENKPVPAGNYGRAVLTNLYNYANPFIRYELTDYIVPGQPSQGHPTLQTILGKTSDELPVLQDDNRPGKIQSHDLAKFHPPGIDLIQFVSHRPDYLEIEYCGKSDIDESIERNFGEFLSSMGASRTGFQVNRVEHIWNSYNGSKLKLIRYPGEELIVLQQSILPMVAVDASQPDVRPKNAYTVFTKDLVQTSISHCFERQVALCPDSIAIKDGPDRLTYTQLNRATNRVAHILHDLAVGATHPVALLFGHKAAMVVAMLGTLKAGGFYFPLDPSFPEKRNSTILDDAHASIILTDTEGLAAAKACAGREATIINLDKIDPLTEDGNLEVSISPDAPACILYTSGSTGKPKGVLLDQRAILHRVMLYTNDYHICDGDRLSLLQMYIYSASTRDIFGSLLNGAGLYLYDLKNEGIHALAQWLIDESITVFYCVPTVFRVFLESLDHEVFNDIRLIRVGGEPVRPKDVEGYQRHFGPGCILVNALASTETETICQYFINHETRIAGNSVPVGYPVRDKEIFLLDENGKRVEDGSIGEIVVSSAYIGPGYWMEAGIHPPYPGAGPEPATRLCHTGDLGFRLPDGRITLTGRKDWTVKVNGQRINPAEIEQLLAGFENIKQAVVMSYTKPDGASALAAYVQPKTRPAPSVKSIRQALETFLPAFMIPSVFMFLDALPMTPGGKIDRQSLSYSGQIQGNTGVEMAPASTPVEEILLGIWRTILTLDQIGMEDKFFELGGDSLQAASLMGQIEEKFGQKLLMSTMVHHDTIRKLAELLTQGENPQPAQPLVVLQPLGGKPPFFLAPGLGTGLLYLHDLVLDMGTDRPIIGLQDAVTENVPLAVAKVEMRARVYLKEIRATYPHGPYYLAGHSFGGLIAIEIGRQLIEQGEEVPLLALLDTLPPGPRQRAFF